MTFDGAATNVATVAQMTVAMGGTAGVDTHALCLTDAIARNVDVTNPHDADGPRCSSAPTPGSSGSIEAGGALGVEVLDAAGIRAVVEPRGSARRAASSCGGRQLEIRRTRIAASATGIEAMAGRARNSLVEASTARPAGAAASRSRTARSLRVT